MMAASSADSPGSPYGHLAEERLGGLSMAQLDARMRNQKLSNAIKQRELEETEFALAEMEGRVGSFALAKPLIEADSHALQVRHEKNERQIQTLEASVSELQNRVQEVQSLLDAREAELYETEEAVRTLERRGQSRTRELAAVDTQIDTLEEGMRRKQAELARLKRTRDGEATAAWWTAINGPGSRNLPKEDEEGDLVALMLRKGVRKAQSEERPEEADFAQFHSLALGIKLSLAGQPQVCTHAGAL